MILVIFSLRLKILIFLPKKVSNILGTFIIETFVFLTFWLSNHLSVTSIF